MHNPFVAIFPLTPQIGDKIILKGKIKENAEKISFNFTIDKSQTPLFIAYHFKTLFNVDPRYAVIQNFKNGECQWGNETISENTWIDGPGGVFELEFKFNEYTISVYTDTGYHYSFEYQCELSDIQTVQIWDDLDYIESLQFLYNKN